MSEAIDDRPPAGAATGATGKGTTLVRVRSPMADAQRLHGEYLAALDAAQRFACNGDLAQLRYICGWCCALRHADPGSFGVDLGEAAIEPLAISGQPLKMGKGEDGHPSPALDVFRERDAKQAEAKLEALRTAARALCDKLDSPEYLRALRFQGADGAAAFAVHVAGLEESNAGRAWWRAQLSEPPPEGSAWGLLSSAEKSRQWIEEWVKDNAREGGEKGAEALAAKFELAERLLENTFADNLAECGATFVAVHGADALDKAMELLSGRLGSSRSPEELRKLFDANRRLVDATVQGFRGKGKGARAAAGIEQYSQDAKDWQFFKGAGELAERLVKALAAINAGFAAWKFYQDPNLKNGVGLAGSMNALLLAFTSSLPLWVRAGRFEDEAAARKAAEEVQKDWGAAARIGEAAEEGKQGPLRFLAEKIAKREGGELIPLLGALQGLFDAAGGVQEMEEAGEQGRTMAAAGAGVYAMGGLLCAAGAVAEGGVPLAALLILAGNVFELAGTLIQTLSPTALQEWVQESAFGTRPKGSPGEQIHRLNQILHAPRVEGEVQVSGRKLTLRIKVGNLGPESWVSRLHLEFAQRDLDLPAHDYELVGGKDYGDYGKVKIEFPEKDAGKTEEIVIEGIKPPGGHWASTVLGVKCALQVEPDAIELEAEQKVFV